MTKKAQSDKSPDDVESLSKGSTGGTTKARNKTMALLLTKEGSHRDTIRGILKKDCQFECEAVSDLDKTTEMLHKTNAGFFLHDWDAYDKTQNHKLHQRLAKMDDFNELFRIIYTAKITADLLALVSDIRIDRIATHASMLINLAGEIDAAISSRLNYSPIQNEIAAIQNKTTKYEQGKIDSIIDEGIATHPKDPAVRMEYANLCYRRNELDQAEEISRKLLGENPRNVRAMTLMSRILMKRGQVDAAQQILETADILSPKNSDRLLMLGDIFYKKGDTDQARSYMQEAVESNPTDQVAVEAYAKFEIGEGNVNEASEFFKNSLSEEEIAGLLNNTAIQSVKNKEFENALKFYDLTLRTLKTDTYRHAVYYNMALAYKSADNFDKALESVKKALELKPDFEKGKRLETALSEFKKQAS